MELGTCASTYTYPLFENLGLADRLWRKRTRTLFAIDLVHVIILRQKRLASGDFPQHKDLVLQGGFSDTKGLVYWVIPQCQGLVLQGVLKIAEGLLGWSAGGRCN